jgi:hypothetical protein
LFEGCACGVEEESGIVRGVRGTLRPPGVRVSQAGGEEKPAGEVAKRIRRWAAAVSRFENEVGRLGERVRPVRATASASELSAV